MFLTSSFILQIVNFLLLIFLNVNFLHKLRHSFLHLKCHLNKIKAIFVIVVSINAIANTIFILISKLYIIAELTE